MLPLGIYKTKIVMLLISYNDLYINRLRLFFIPIVLLAKLVRYTVMYDRLVALGIGWNFIYKINSGGNSFGITLSSFDVYGNHGSKASSNVIALCEHFNFMISDYYGWEIFISLIFNILLYKCIVTFYRNHYYISSLENVFIYLNIAILNIFCFCLAKEFFQMIFWFITMLALKGETSRRKGMFKVILALIVTLLFTRKYYALVLIYFVIVDIVLNYFFKRINMDSSLAKFKIIIGIFVTLAIMSIMYYLMSMFLAFEVEDTYEELERVNSTDRGGNASSTILPIFYGGSVEILTLEYFIKIFRLMFPVELLWTFKPTYAITIFYQAIIFIIIIRSIKNRKFGTVENTFATDLYIAFWLTSAAFEPDFGSWLRHQSVVFPVILYMLGSHSFATVYTVNTQYNYKI